MSIKKSKKTQQFKSTEKQQHLDLQEESTREQATKKPIFSELYQILYQPKMKTIKIQEKQQLYQLLRHNYFSIKATKRTLKLEKFYIKTNWQSTKYRIKLSNLQTQFTILKLHTNFRNFTPRPFAKGQFGQVSSLKCDQKQYALKNIKINPEQDTELEKAFHELFMMKVASCLKAGPYIQNIFGYDAILFHDCLQIPMQMCLINFNEKLIHSELKNQELYKSLKRLHSFQIYHGDIKYDNIGWSKKYQKFVFLDFGFTKILEAAPGQKSLTKFAGTFRYCSQQMRKLYFLCKTGYADLYYNDLCCLQKTISQLQNEITSSSINFYKSNLSKQQLQSQNYFQDPESNHMISVQSQYKINLELGLKCYIQMNQTNYAHVCSFYLLKYYLFYQNYQKIIKLVKSEQTLIYTFRKLLYQEVKQFRDYKVCQQIIQIYQKYADFCEDYSKKSKKIKKFDALFFDYLLNFSYNKPIINKKQKIINLIEMDKFENYLQQIWGKQKWMQQFFYFINDEVYKDKIIPPLKKKFLSILFHFIRKNLPIMARSKLKRLPLRKNPVHVSSMLHEVLIVLFQYFNQNKNIQILEEIMPYFIIFMDQYNLQVMEQIILEFYQPDLINYLRKNMQFFIGKLTCQNKCSQYYLKCIKRVEQKLSFLKSQQENKQMKKAIIQSYQSTLNIMKKMCLFKSYYNYKINFSEADKQITKYLQKPQAKLLHPHVLYMLQKYVYFQQFSTFKIKNMFKNRGFNDPKIKSKYLQTYKLLYLQLQQIEVILRNDQKLRLETIFLQIFFPFCLKHAINLKTFEFQGMIQHFLDIRLNHVFDIGQYQILIIFEMIGKPQEVTQAVMSYFLNVNLQIITNASKVINIYQALFRCLCVMVPGKNIQIWRLYSDLRKKLGAFTLFFLQITQFLIKQVQDSQNIDPLVITKNQFIFHFQQTKGIALIVLQQYNQAAMVFLQITVIQQLVWSPFHHICTLYEHNSLLKQQIKILIRQKLYKIYQIVKTRIQRYQLISANSLISRTMLQITIQKKGEKAGFEQLLSLLINGNAQNMYFINLNAKPCIQYFTYSCSPNKLFNYINQIIQNNTIKFKPTISILLFQLYIRITAQFHLQIEKNQLKKILIICILGFQKMKHINLSWQKKYISILILKYFKKPKKFSNYKQLIQKSKNNFINQIKKKIRSLTKKHTPELIRQKIQCCLFKILNCFQMEEQQYK